ncbi:MAG: PmoA family protein [Armatimonadetes bacterium]|nr:PmoA family protein [Armatimonadota bacterium]
MKIVHDLGQSVELRGDDGDVALRYAYGQDLAPKPFFYPLCLPNGGNFGAYRPADHMWHRGLWFTWKFVNGANYWEEGRGEEGHQHTLRAPEVIVEDFGKAITLSSELEWRHRDQKTIREARRVRYSPGAEIHVMDWDVRQTALQDLLIDRTPYTTWGGYGGLVIRAPQSLRNGTLLFPDGRNADYVAGEPDRWCDLSGQMDGAPDRHGGMAFLDHPENPRHPVPFYARTRPLDNFMNAALLFHEPLKLKEGEELRLRYRVLLHKGRLPVEALNRQWEEYAGSGV